MFYGTAAVSAAIFDATVAPLLMPDYPTRMSISATMWLSSSLSHPPCYLQDRDEIADEVIIAQARNRCVKVKVTTVSVHPITVQSDINPRATVASIKVLFSGHKSLNSHSFCPYSRPCSRHFALSNAVFRLHTGQSSLTLL